jgi:hypothetical protein
MGLDRKWLAEIWNGGFDPSRHRRLSPLLAHDFHVVSIQGLVKRKLTLSLWEASDGTHAELVLAFLASIGFKRGDFMTTGMNEKRVAWLCRV